MPVLAIGGSVGSSLSTMVYLRMEGGAVVVGGRKLLQSGFPSLPCLLLFAPLKKAPPESKSFRKTCMGKIKQEIC